jgi:hypothetical protein
MVDALEAVRTRLRPRGVVVDLQPDLTYQPAVYVGGRSRRLFVGAVTRTPDENILAAHVARDRAVAQGKFRLVASGGASFQVRHDLASFERELADNENWSLPRGFRARLAAARRAAGPETTIQIGKRFNFVVLRRI